MSTQGSKDKYETSKMEIEVPTVLKEIFEDLATQSLFGDDDDNRMANLMMTTFVGWYLWAHGEVGGRALLESQYEIAVAPTRYINGRFVIGEQITLDGTEPILRRSRFDPPPPDLS